MTTNTDMRTLSSEKKHQLQIVNNVTKELFQNEIYPRRRPVILKDIDIGSCRETWTVAHLTEMGGEKDVKIHVSTTPNMDFINKNFVYRSLPFSTFVHRAAETKHTEYFLAENEFYYLRALGDDPRKDIADIRHQFPKLAEEIVLPEFFDPSQFYSSVFRIASSGLRLWTHYDVMDNLLVQVTGRKRVVLFGPREVENLYLSGDKSEVIDIDNPDLEKYPKFADAKRYEGHLDPGDVLFIPALWFHNVISLDFGIAVNVFWKHLSADKYDQKDTYGNKDPHAATRATQIVDRALKTLEELPDEYRDFYARRLVSRIQTKAYLKEETDIT